MKIGSRKAWFLLVLAGFLLTIGTACEPQEDVIVYERDPTVDPETKAKRLMSSARQYLDSELYSQAELAYREVVDLQPDNKTALANLAFSVRAQERGDEAFELYKMYTANFPDDADGFARLGAIYDDRGDLGNAAEATGKAVELSPEDATLRHELGNYYVKLEKWEEAQTQYEKAIELDPENDDYHGILANIYKELGKTDELLAARETQLAKDPENPKLIASVARLNLDVENYDRSRELYEQLVELDEGNVALLKNLAIIQLRTADTTAAIATYKKVVAADRSDADAYIKLADFQATKSIGDYESAVRNVQTGLELNPDHAQGWCVWGTVMEHMGRYEQAITKFEKAAGLKDPYWSGYAQKEVLRQQQLIEREKRKKEKEEYDKLEEL